MTSAPPRHPRDATRAAVEEAFADLLAADEVDILPADPGASGVPSALLAADGESADELDVAGEEWTLHLEGFPGPRLAYLAVEDEPEVPTPESVRVAREASVPSGALAAMVALDAQLGGALVSALRASNDLLSFDLADALAGADRPESS